ncbi:MoxR family ATPase [Thiomicrorhabdus sp. zzn3]|uniref:AAA family ATPase n=1 Tax=Thiomicrorhabdus sp. zzn3 TaxID=3039775 RepID=UPI002436EEE5|nr:MoxR family ATPase [Thiomicrorhabdus sp. zzn3]MDG6778797.1 MoxR family ATPase [Thiomicrorhabdus sp. zzn3]
MDSNALLAQRFQSLQDQINRHIIGQPHLTARMLIALLSDGHLLVEGPPGLAKTKAIKVLAKHLEGSFHRIQFTPDLLPSDITGTEVYRPETGTFEFQSGPIFHNLILADEINRAPAKVQSALLEAMAEGQVSIGKRTLPMDKLFMVMATQNPLEQEGTYPLPEAQLDRFMFHVKIDYPTAESEYEILELVEQEARSQQEEEGEHLTQQDLFAAREAILNLHMADAVKTYLVELVMATRNPQAYNTELAGRIAYGVSPRATLALSRGARAHAWLQGKDFVSPDDVQAVVHDTFRHRLLLTFEAEAEGISVDQITDQLLQLVAVV